MKKEILFLFIAVVLVLTLVGCSDKGGGQLSAPENVRVEEDVVYWDNVENAGYYSVDVNGRTFIREAADCCLDFVTTGLSAGEYTIKVKACGDGKKYADSDYSASINFTYGGKRYNCALNVVSSGRGGTNITSKNYLNNSSIDLVAYPEDGYHFCGWYSDKYYKIGNEPSINYVITEDTLLYAKFERNVELAEASVYEESEIMECPVDFSVVIRCAKGKNEEYIRNNLFIYDSFYLDPEGNVARAKDKNGNTIALKDGDGNVISYDELDKEASIEYVVNSLSSGDDGNIYVVKPKNNYQICGSYVAKAQGDLTILKESSRRYNANMPMNAVGEANIEEVETDNLSFSMEHGDIRANIVLQDYVYVYYLQRYADDIVPVEIINDIDGTCTDKVGKGITDEETGLIGGFVTDKIAEGMGVGSYVGFGGKIGKHIALGQITEETVFGQIEDIVFILNEEYGNDLYPVYFVQLKQVEKDSDIFAELDVYDEGEINIEEALNEEDVEAIKTEARNAFVLSDDYHEFLAAVNASAEDFADENGYEISMPMNAASFWDKVHISCDFTINFSEISFVLTGAINIPFENKNGKFIKSSGNIAISFEFKEVFEVNYEFSWIKKDVKIWFIEFQFTSGVDLKIIAAQSTSFTFDAAVKFSAESHGGQEQPATYVLNEKSYKIHTPHCKHLKTINTAPTRTVKEKLSVLENQGYVACLDCIGSNVSDDYVINHESKIAHNEGCIHLKKLDPSKTETSSKSIQELIYLGYEPCGTCMPEEKYKWKDEEATVSFLQQMAKKLSYQDWGDKLKEIKAGISFAKDAPNASKDIQICEFPIVVYCVVIRLRLALTMEFSIEATAHYEFKSSNRTAIGLRASIFDGFQTYYSHEESGQSSELTLIGKIGLKVGLKLSIAVEDPLGLISIGIYGTVGVYSDLAGVVHLSNTGENYAAAYFELGIYYDFGITYRVITIKGNISLRDALGLGDGKIPLLRMGYNKVIYAYANQINERMVTVTNEKNEFSLDEIGVIQVKNYSLPEMKTGIEKLDVYSDKYQVNVSLQNGEYFYYKDGKIVVKDTAPVNQRIEDVVTISLSGVNTEWSQLNKGEYRVAVYLPTISFKIICDYQCVKHAYVYLDEIEATCMEDGFASCYTCSLCNELFNLELDEIPERNIIKAKGHIEEYLEGTATCTEPGLEKCYYCSRCGLYFSYEGKRPMENREYMEPLGHDDSAEFVITKQPGCDTAGLKVKRCVRCDEIVAQEIILPTGHQIIGDKEPSCEKSIQCSICNKILAPQMEHVFSEEPDSVHAVGNTCNESSYSCFRCKNCDFEKKVYSGNAINHSDGNSDGVCDVCHSNINLAFDINTKSDGYIVSGKGLITSDTFVVIPNLYNGLPVKAIGKEAFKNCKNIISIYLPESIETIDEEAFYGCNKLIEIYNLSGLNVSKGSVENGYIGYYAKDIYRDKKQGSKIIKDNNGFIMYLFEGKKHLIGYEGINKFLTLPVDLDVVGAYALYKIDSVIQLTISQLSSNCIIDENAFYQCENLLEIYDKTSSISKGQLNVGHDVNIYNDEEGESKIEIYQAGFIIYDGYILIDYTGKEDSLINVPSNVTMIWAYAFRGNTILKRINIDRQITFIGKKAFSDCYSFKEINFIDFSDWHITIDDSDAKSYSNGEEIIVSGIETTARKIKGEYQNYYWYKDK